MFWMAKSEAAWPEASASAATPPSSAAMRSSSTAVGRIHDAGVDVAEFLQREQVGRVLGVAELVGGRLVDRHRDRVGGRIAAVAGVQHDGLRMLAVGRHFVSPFGQFLLRQSV